MSTRSAIGIKLDDGRIESIYCHSDGYLEYNGKILLRHYSDLNKIKKLLSFGDLSSLGENIEPEVGKKHGFEFSERQEGVCVFYNRDRGDSKKDTKSRILEDEFYFVEHYDWSEYFYLWKDGRWLACCRYNDLYGEPVEDYNGKKFYELKTLIDQIDNKEKSV